MAEILGQPDTDSFRTVLDQLLRGDKGLSDSQPLSADDQKRVDETARKAVELIENFNREHPHDEE